MPQTGVLILGDQIIGYTERWMYCYWDIDPEILSERNCSTVEPYYSYFSSRYASHEHIQYTYNTRWFYMEYEEIPVTDRWVYMYYSLTKYTERMFYFYPDTAERLCFYESLLTSTPLLLKYPKYYDWTYIPQVINPEFKVWSYYPINETDITLHIMSDGAGITEDEQNIFLNSGVNPTKFKIEQEGNTEVYKIIVNVDAVFKNSEKIDLYFSLHDIKGNHLKPGLW